MDYRANFTRSLSKQAASPNCPNLRYCSAFYPPKCLPTCGAIPMLITADENTLGSVISFRQMHTAGVFFLFEEDDYCI